MMKPISEQDHYEMLEVERAASTEDIERAYRLARSTYSMNSLAGYSVFGNGDLDSIRERIETAYRVLSDRVMRVAYDSSQGWVSEWKSLPMPEREETRVAIGISQIEAFEDLGAETGEYDGARLRRARARRGWDLDELSAITKVTPRYLQLLEEERFEELPARVYVRGFVDAYAFCMGLDRRAATTSYMRRYDRGVAELESPSRKRR